MTRYRRFSGRGVSPARESGSVDLAVLISEAMGNFPGGDFRASLRYDI